MGPILKLENSNSGRQIKKKLFIIHICIYIFDFRCYNFVVVGSRTTH